MSHSVKRISFGQEFPGIRNPLDEVEKISDDEYSSMYTYYIKVNLWVEGREVFPLHML
tara:strand:- start:619 stop:792 length:174 start_codon:yes stop_codon:yes gene_type:complete